MQQQTGRVVSDAGSQVLTEITHGGHVLTEDSEEAAALAGTQESVVAAESAAATGTPFDYLFDGLAADFPNHHLPGADAAAAAATVAALEALGSAMVEDPPPTAEPLEPLANSSIPPVYTYWGQFVDHDLTANTDRDSAISDITRPDLAPLAPGFVTANLFNLRQPALNLDSVYGDGPAGSPELYDGIRLKVGTVAETSDNPARPIGGDHIPPETDARRDLPRAADGTATIGDARNDENLIVAQLHTAFLRFHNAAVDWVRDHDPGYDTDTEVFDRARQLTQWHYQWLVIHDFLQTVTAAGVADQVLLGGNQLFRAARRRGLHAAGVLRRGVPLRPQHGPGGLRLQPQLRPPEQVIGSAPFNLLFHVHRQGGARRSAATPKALPFNWVIEWDRFVDHGAVLPDRFARRIDTRLAPPLRDLLNEGNDRAGPDRQGDPQAPGHPQPAARISPRDPDRPGGRAGDGRDAADGVPADAGQQPRSSTTRSPRAASPPRRRSGTTS